MDLICKSTSRKKIGKVPRFKLWSRICGLGRWIKTGPTSNAQIHLNIKVINIKQNHTISYIININRVFRFFRWLIVIKIIKTAVLNQYYQGLGPHLRGMQWSLAEWRFGSSNMANYDAFVWSLALLALQDSIDFTEIPTFNWLNWLNLRPSDPKGLWRDWTLCSSALPYFFHAWTGNHSILGAWGKFWFRQRTLKMAAVSETRNQLAPQCAGRNLFI